MEARGGQGPRARVEAHRSPRRNSSSHGGEGRAGPAGCGVVRRCVAEVTR